MIQTLEHTIHQDIVDCLHEAFSDYAIPMKMPSQYWADRWTMSAINKKLSYGYFEGGTLKGFILHGIDTWHNEICFYNMATGVEPGSRRKGALVEMYEKAIPALKEAGCKKGYLEVLCNNQKAIRAYQKCGFEIIDRAHSFIVPKDLSFNENLRVEKIQNWDPWVYGKKVEHQLSFEHRPDIVARNPGAFGCYALKDATRSVAFAVVKESNHNIVQFAFENNTPSVYGESLFAALAERYKGIKIVNISEKNEALQEFFKRHSFGALISQFMMCTELA